MMRGAGQTAGAGGGGGNGGDWGRDCSYWDLEGFQRREIDRALCNCYFWLRELADLEPVINLQSVMIERLQEMDFE